MSPPALHLPIVGLRFAMAATDSKMNDHSLHSVSRPEKVGHLFITRKTTCPPDVVAGTAACWAFQRQSLSFSELLAHFARAWANCSTVAMFGQHDSSIQWMISAPLSCCNVWMTNPFLTHHEKAVRTKCHKVSQNTAEHSLVRR